MQTQSISKDIERCFKLTRLIQLWWTIIACTFPSKKWPFRKPGFYPAN